MPESIGSPSVEICIVHDEGDARIAEFLARKLCLSHRVSLLSAWPGDVEPWSLKCVRGLGARLASVELSFGRSSRIVILGVNSIGGAVGRGVAAYLLGQNCAVDGVYSIFADAPGDLSGSLTEVFPQINLQDSLPCWSQEEDARRFKRLDGILRPEGYQRLLDEIAALESEPAFRAAPAMLLPLKPSAEGVAEVFCIPGAGSSVISFIDIAQLAPAGFSVIGLQPRGLDGQDPPATSAESVAAAFSGVLAQRAAVKPLHLVGHSYGGYIAFELANRLCAEGAPPASLTLIDTRPPRDSKWSIDMDDGEVALGWIRLCELAAQKPLNVDGGRLRKDDLLFNLRVVQKGMIDSGLLPSNVDHDMLVGPMRMFAACVRNWYCSSSTYSGPMRLVYLAEPDQSDAANSSAFREFESGWRRYAPRLTSCQGPGNHITGLKRPYADELVKLMGWNLGESTRHDQACVSK